MAQPDNAAAGMPAGELASSITQALLDNAQRLGLTWGLRPAKVESVTEAGVVMAVYDGDSEAIAMTSMIGTVSVSQRVYAIAVPPAGNFIVGATQVDPATRLRSGAFSLTGGATPKVSWTVVDQKDGGPWLTAVPSTTITFPATGWYSCTMQLFTDTAGSAGSFQWVDIGVISSKVTNWTGSIYRTNWGVNGRTGAVSVTRPFIAGDTIQCGVFQNSAGSMQCTAEFAALRVKGFVL